MGVRKKIKDFRDWCPQPPDHLPAKLKRYSIPIAAVFTMTVIFSLSFFVFSSGLMSHPIVPVVPLANEQTAWSTQTAAMDGSFGAIDLALDSNNNPHVVYTGANGLMYYASWDGSSWKIQSVIQGGTPNSLILDSNNVPHILYKGSNGVTYYASWDGQNWNYQTVPSGYGYSLALDSEGKPHVAYASQLPVSNYPTGVTNDISMLNYASWDGSNWNIQTVDSPISYTDSIYLALDQQNNPHIMYGYDTYYPPSGDSLLTVKFAGWSGSNWSIQTAISGLDYFGNMALDSKGYPHFIYAVENPHSSTNNSTLGYASWDGASWNTQTVISNAGLGLFIGANLALDSHNDPHIEFFNGSLMYTSSTGSSWNFQTVAPSNFAYGEGPLALDSSGNPHICYWVDDIQNKTAFVSRLLYATQTPVQTKQAPAATPTSLSTKPISASVTQLWNFKTAGSDVFTPIVANGYVYFASEMSEGPPETLYCVDASTGSQVWNQTGDLLGFTVSNGNIYVGEGLPGAIACLNAYTGVQRWNYTYGTDFGTPVVEGGIVYAGGQSYSVSTGGEGGFIFALNASTGAEIWSFLAPSGARFDENSISLPSNGQTMDVSGGYMYAVSAVLSDSDSSWHSGVYAFDASTGKEAWNYTALGEFSSLVAGGQNVYVSSEFVDTTNYINSENASGKIYAGGILALNSLNGEVVWNYPISSSVQPLIITDSMVYATSDDGNVYALDAANGTAAWKYTAGTGLGSLLLANSYLYAGSSAGVYCFDASNGKVIWNFATSDFADSSPTNPTYADGVIYLGWNGPMFFSPVTEHNFYALDAWNGQKLWNCTLGYTVASTPLFANGTVYVGGNFVSAKSPDSESSGAVLALKSDVTSLPFTPPNQSQSPSTSAQSPSANQNQDLLNPVIPAALTIIVAVLVATAILLLKQRKKPTS